MNKTLIIVVLFFLLAVDWLTFHDIFEPHSVRDWMILAISVLVFIKFLNDLLRDKPKLVKS